MANKPDFNLLAPVEYRDGKTIKTRFIKFGAMWKNQNGEGYSGKVDFWPVGAGEGNRVVMLPPKDQAGGDDGEMIDAETGEVLEDDAAF